MSQRIGVVLLRRGACLVVVEQSPESASITVERTQTRQPQGGVASLLRSLLSDAPLTWRRSPLVLALSASDLACADTWVPGAALSLQSAVKAGPALCEMRCASEALEELLVEVSESKPVYQALAIKRALADDILEVTRGFNLVAVTAVPAVLAQSFAELSLRTGGERIDVSTGDGVPTWRARPFDGVDETGTVCWKGQDIPRTQAAALAAAVCDLDTIPNLLQALPQYRTSFSKRYRDLLLSIAAASALCFGGLGVHFHREAVRDRDELAVARRTEMELWARYLPDQEPREGRLLQSLRGRLEDRGETSGNTEFPSALSFWGAIGKHMPDPDGLSLTLESLDLAPEGGRISARVPAAKEDPLKNASQLESQLNQSAGMSARGDYEVRDGQVHIRLRMDYKP